MSKRWRLTVLLVVGAMVTLSASVSVASTPGAVVFLAAGDYSTQPAASAVLNRMALEPSDLTLALGDLSYGTVGAESAFCDFVTSRVGAGYPFEVVSGNHESNGLNGNINDFSPCLPNQLPGVIGTYGRQYYVDVPQGAPLVRYIMVSPALTFPDSLWSYPAGSARYQWTSNAIDSARTAGIPWVVVGMHKPCLSVGEYSCDPGADLYNLLITKKVDLILTGHEHLYQRTKQLALGAGCPALQPTVYNSSCVVDGDSTLVKGAGTVAVTAGTGGVPLRDAHADDTELPYFASTEGLNTDNTHGFLKVSATTTDLTANFIGTDGAFTDNFSISAGTPPPNQPPTAAFTSTCNGLSCTFNGAGSTDFDGTITNYSWDFGDATTGSGPNPAHSYATGNTYAVSLTVTDNGGLTSTISQNVIVTTPVGPTYFAQDTFERTTATGFGAALLGGTWSSASGTSVSGGAGAITVAAGTTATTRLDAATAAATDLRATVWADKAATGGGIYFGFIAHRVSGFGDYRANVRFNATGKVVASLVRAASSGVETVIQAETAVPGLVVVAGDKVNVRVLVTGSSPTTIQLKVWKVGTTEPTGWLRSVTDATAGLQTAGSTGLRTYLSSSATNAPVTVRVDDWLAAVPQ